MQFSQYFIEIETELVISSGGVYIGEVRVQRSYIVVNRHVIVIENDEEIVGRCARVVESLKCQSAAD